MNRLNIPQIVSSDFVKIDPSESLYRLIPTTRLGIYKVEAKAASLQRPKEIKTKIVQKGLKMIPEFKENLSQR